MVLVFGARRAQIPIPGTSCSLRVEPLNWLIGAADRSAPTRWVVRVPGPIRNATVFVQALVLDVPQIRTSNALEIRFSD